MSTPSTPDWFVRYLLLILLLAGGVRLWGADHGAPCDLVSGTEEVAAALAKGHCYSFNDAVEYKVDAKLNAEGHWFETLASGQPRQASALHAPLYPVLLTPFVAAGIDTIPELERVLGLLGVLTVAAAAFVMKRVAGPSVGLVAAFLVAVHPLVWINDVVAMPEGLYALVVLGVIALAYRFHDAPTLGRAGAFGAGLGLAVLTRNEAAFAIGFVGLPLALGARGLDLRARLGRWLVMGALLAAVLAPWVLFNTARFDAVIFTNGAGAGTSSGTCDDTFYDSDLLGLRSVDCLRLTADAPLPKGVNTEVATDRIQRARARAYYGDHLGRAPTVVAARVGRFWSVYRPFQTVRLDDVIEQRGILRSQVGIVVTWILLPFAAHGALVLYRRRVPLSPLLGWLGCATIVAASNTPLLRFRGVADLCIAMLAAVGLHALWVGPLRDRFPALASDGTGAGAEA